MNNTGNVKKIFPIELLRIIACCMVITIHTMLPVQYGELFDSSLVLLSCIIGDAVAIFWLIGGCFVFNGDVNYIKRIKKSFMRIGIPIVVFSLLWFYFEKTALTGCSLSESFSHTKDEYIGIFRSLLRWKSPVLGYYWYLFTHLFIIICFPILHSFVRYLDEHSSAEKWFLAISILFFIINDFCENETFYFSQNSIIAVIPASVEMIWGHVLYKNRDKLKLKGNGLVWGGLFIFTILVRWRFQMTQYQTDGSTHLLYWYSSFGIICASCLLLFSVLTFKKPSNNIVKRIVYYNGARTLFIYMIHEPVRMILYRFGFREMLISMTVDRFHGLPGEFFYTIGMTLTIYLLCLLFIMIFDLLHFLAKSMTPALKTE